jgi:ketosteroid isomerase-like protein
VRRLLFLGLLAWLGIAPHQATQHSEPAANRAPEDEAIRKEIISLDQELNNAAVQGNMKLFARVMPDNYVGVAPNGMILQKSLIAAHYQAGTLHYEAVVDSDVRVRLHGDCAVLTAVATVKGRDGDTDLSGTYRIMRVFLRRDAEWQIIAFQATPMRPPSAN